MDTDYKLSQLDGDAATLVQMSYNDAKFVEIGGNVLTAKQLRPNAKEKFILNEVILFQINIDNTNMQTPTMY
jgi:hypothetical protein